MRDALIVLAIALGCGCSGRGCRGKEIDADSQKKARPAAVAGPAIQACIDGVRAITEYTDRCEGGHEWWGSIDRAVEQLRPGCEAMAVAPGAKYERTAVDACGAALKTHACGMPLPEPCHTYGTRKHGELCAFAVQCVRGSFCKTDLDTLCGVCERAARHGEACDDRMCDEDLLCIDHQCARPRESGDKCATDSECKRMLFCEQSPVGGTCRAYNAEGEPCAEGLCAPSLSCEAGKCKKRPPPAGPGSKCANSLDCRDFSCVAGTCRPLGEAGDKCDPSSAEVPQCGPAFMCHKGRCAVPDPHACR